MSNCPACGHENKPGAKFCSECGVALAAPGDTRRQERKVVTVLFADLVGFTSRAERMDPEDVRELLSPYYARLRNELEHFGGTVEKFIGDAVMALFGAPRAHEDDPERAVRAAFAIRDWVREEERLQVRIAVNTGEALVTLDARASEGEGMAAGDVVNTTARLQSAAPVNGILVGESTYRATRHAIEYTEAPPGEALVTLDARASEGEGMAAGDVVNTTARLQNAAPVNGILVGESTYRATRHAIEYTEAPPVEAKGKEEPIAVWEALQARASFGVDVPQEARTELVGRERELGVVRDALDRVREERSPQLVTLVGVPGIGKSRLLYELSRVVEDDPDLISWRQGRSLPYGEGVSFWALAEMVKAQAGILESDDVAEVEAKLARIVADVVPDDEEAGWVRRHLGALVGLIEGEVAVGGGRQGEVFSAWSRFLEALAEQRPLVLVFEDLHWADDGLLDFVDHLVDWASDVPILVVGTARPELLERRPGWGGGKANSTTLSLAPLSNDDTARLIGSLLGSPLLEAGEQAELLARAGGNPLYAEQYAQMASEQDGAELPLPESIQGIIGARLDALTADEKRLLQDAAVIGKVFWPAAVVALGGEDDPVQVEARLRALERKQFVRRERRSSVGGETQYAFLHVLLRDVAYGQIPRASRVEKHVLAAAWVEALGRSEDTAEMLAHHYLSAFEVARAARRDVAVIAPRARAAIREAGDRARTLNAFAAATRFYGEALELWPEEAREERADLLFRLGLAAFGEGTPGRAGTLEEARTALLAVGDLHRAAEIDSLLGQVWWNQGRNDLAFEHLERGYDLVRDSPPSPEKARVLSQLARYRLLAGPDMFDPEEAREALELAEAFGLDEIRAHALITIGSGRQVAGDAGGRQDVERGLEVALAANRLEAAARAYTNLGAFASGAHARLDEALRFLLEAQKVAQRLGSDEQRRWTQGNLIELLVDVGRWDEAARAADDFLAESEAAGPHYQDTGARNGRALIRLGRGDVQGALDDQMHALAAARLAKDPQVLYPALATSSAVLADAGRLPDAGRVLDELLARTDRLGVIGSGIADLVWVAGLVDRRAELRQLLGTPRERPWQAGALSLLDGDFATAAATFEAGHALRSAALIRLRAAEALVAAGRRAEADEQLRQALAFFRSVGATRYLRAGEALLAASA